MKRTALAILVLALVAGLVGSAAAQQPPDSSSPKAPASGSTPGTTESKSTDVNVNVGGSGAPSSPGTAPGAKAPDVKIDSKTEIRNGGDSGGSALPRAAASDRTTIFGLSPTAAVILAAALLVVVILAIVAMTRTSTTTIDDHRL